MNRAWKRSTAYSIVPFKNSIILLNKPANKDKEDELTEANLSWRKLFSFIESPGKNNIYYFTLKQNNFGSKLFDAGSQPYFPSSLPLQALTPVKFIAK